MCRGKDSVYYLIFFIFASHSDSHGNSKTTPSFFKGGGSKNLLAKNSFARSYDAVATTTTFTDCSVKTEAEGGVVTFKSKV